LQKEEVGWWRIAEELPSHEFARSFLEASKVA
jgi:hypothetical protein